MKTLPGLLFVAILVLARGDRPRRFDDLCHCKVRGDNEDVKEFNSILIPYGSNDKCSSACVATWNTELNSGYLNAGAGQVLCDSLEKRNIPSFGPATVYLYFRLTSQPWTDIKGIQSKQPLYCYNGQYIPPGSLDSFF